MANYISEDATVEENQSRISKFFSFKNILLLLFLLIFLNLLGLDLLIINGWNVKMSEKIITTSVASHNSINTNVCSQDCIFKINAVSDMIKGNKAISLTPSPTPFKQQVNTVSNSSTSVKEYYVPFGSGSGSSPDWQDVSGLQASVDSASYGNIKSVVFEASLHVPTSNEIVSVRLYNATDKHPVWNSDITFIGDSSSVFLVSPSINLDSGSKVYKVQMKTQLQSPAILDQSRLHITVK